MSRFAPRWPFGFDLLLGLLAVGLAAQVKPSPQLYGMLALLALAVLVWPAAATAGHERRRTRLIVYLALISLTVTAGRDFSQYATSWKVRVWNVYHYYLGAKYFEELGYTDLYEATLLADREEKLYWRRISRVRNLRTYKVEDRRTALGSYEPAATFDRSRWEAFKTDVLALSRQMPPGAWRGVFTDRGYNGTPFWTVMGGGLAHLAPADRPWALKLLSSLDLWLLGATFYLIWRVFGLRSAALVLLLFNLTPVNHGRLVGGFLQFDWFCAVAISCCFYRQKRDVLAAGAMAYAALTRIFPVLFVVAVALPLLASWWRWRRPPRRLLRFLAAFVLWCGAGFVLSLANGRGWGGWREFVTGITVHREHHLYGSRRIGLQQVFTHDLASFDFDGNRRQIYAEQERGFQLAAAALCVYFLGVAWRCRSWSAQVLGLVPIFALVLTSRYYAAYLALLPLAGGPRGPPEVRARWLAAAQLGVFAAFYAYASGDVGAYAEYSVLNLLLTAFFWVVLTVELVGSIRRGRSVKMSETDE